MWCVMGMGENVVCDRTGEMWCVMGMEKMWCVMGMGENVVCDRTGENVVFDGGGRKCGV